MAQAILIPSKVLVPLPISSRIIRLCGVAFFNISAVSCISTINVLCPADRLSNAPIRVKILSVIQIDALFAGIKDPTCAIITRSAVWRKTVDFPAILGPVIISIWLFLLLIFTELGTNRSPVIIFSTTGCRPSSIIISPCLFISGII